MKYLMLLLAGCFFVSYASAETVKEPASKQTETVADYNKQKLNSITEDEIRLFTKIQTNLHKGSFQDYLDFIQVRFADNVFSKDTTVTIFENQPKQTQESTAYKKDILKEAQAVYDLMKGAKIINRIDAIVIAPDKKSASVKDTTYFFNMISADPSKPDVKIGIEHNSKCDNIFRISKDNVLQLAQSICIADIKVKQ